MGNINYVKLRKFSFRYVHYMYCDTQEYLLDQLLINRKIHAVFGDEYGKTGTPYVWIKVKVHKKDEEGLLAAFKELYKKAIVFHYRDYDKVVEDMMKVIACSDT